MINLLFILSSLVFAKNFPVEIREQVSIYNYKLNNGLDVYITKNAKAPAVSVFHWVKAGSLQEQKGITGIAHLFEHMMFRPVRTGEKGFFDRISPLGGSANANTRYMATVYTTTVPTQHIEDLLRLEADRFQNLVVTDELLNVERKAVWSEYSTKIDTNPIIDIWGKIYQVGFPGHPYEWTIMGYRPDLEKINAKDCNAFFAKYYRPNNIGLFISGDVNPEKTIALVKKYYGDWKAGENILPVKEFSKATKYIQASGKVPSDSKQILLGFRLKNEDKAQLEYMFLNHILFGSNNSLAEKRLKQTAKLVSNVSDFNYDYDNGMMKGFFILLPQTTTSTVVNEVLKLKADVEKLDAINFDAYKQEFITAVLEGTLRNEALNESLALSWGKYHSIDIFLDWTANIRSLTKESIVKALDGIFTKNNMVVVTTKTKE